MKKRLYIVGREDLGPGLRSAQVGHAAFAFALEHTRTARKWHPNYLILTQVPSERDLVSLVRTAKWLGIKHSVWREPDLDDEITAVALAPGRRTRLLCKRHPLLMQEITASTPSEFVDWR